MDIATGISIGTLGVSAAAVCISVIKARGNNGSGSPPKICDLHSGVAEAIGEIKTSIRTIEDDIKTLLSLKRGE